MPPLTVLSEFQPTGDQPQAIQQLANGIQQGMRHQVLLGVTGSGKSLGYDEPVYVVEKRGTAIRQRVTPIGPLVDQAVQDNRVQLIDDAEIIELTGSPVEYFAQSFDPGSGQVALRPIRAFSRHQPTHKMYRLRTACGRQATLTADHNLWVLREGQLQLIETGDALPSDYLPVPERLIGPGSQHTLDVLELLQDSGRELVVQAGSAAVAEISEASGTGADNRLYQLQHQLHGEGVLSSTFGTLLDRAENLKGHRTPTAATLLARHTPDSLPAQVALTPEFLAFLGYYVAEGNCRRGHSILANRSPSIRQTVETALAQVGIHIPVRTSTDCQIFSTPLTELLNLQCGGNARSKRLPVFWSNLADADLSQLLRAYFDGVGTVETGGAVSALTASEQLASDLMYALLRFGIWARVRRRWQRATNPHHPGDWHYQVRISGQSDLRRFREAIGFSLPHKQARLEQLCKLDGNSDVDVVPIDGADLQKLRIQLSLRASELGRMAGVERPAVLLIEGNHRHPQRSSLQQILSALAAVADKRSMAPAWWETWHRLNSLCTLRWTPIAAVEQIAYAHPYVYDFTVPGPETFLAGTGGFFVHNTYTMAKVIEEVQKPTLIIAHNKTLAAQLYSEFREFFPNNAVEYFVSYYDYYQPEAYIPRTDTFIEKDSAINEEIDRLRLAATSSLLSRRDVVIVASVSCIFGLGSPQAYGQAVLHLRVGELVRRNTVLRHLVEIFYERNDDVLQRGRFRVRGDVLEVQPADREFAYRISLWGEEIERITEIDSLTGEVIADHQQIDIFPAKHFITPRAMLEEAMEDIRQEMEEQVALFESQGKLLEAQRIKQRTNYDLEMLREVGTCSGIENYSRPLARRPAGSTPWTLLDYFPADWLLIIDESHMTVPQIRGMYNGDQQRKSVLVEYGFRLPSALDNRPLRFDEFEQHVNQAIYVSATPGPYEHEHGEQVVEQVIRPTGLVDPRVEVRPTEGQIDDLLKEIKLRVAKGQRVLVTTLTKRMAEDLTEYLAELNIKVHYLHSDIHTIERVEILRDLRMGVYDVVVGINLLREGLDLPEVSLVAILDADKEGFLRSGSALIQNIGRAARHIEGMAILYADKLTDAMKSAIEETNRRREIQMRYNLENNIEPRSIVKGIRDLTDRVRMLAESKVEYSTDPEALPVLNAASLPKDELARLIKQLEKEMKEAAKALEFEKAAALRDQVMELRGLQVEGELAR